MVTMGAMPPLGDVGKTTDDDDTDRVEFTLRFVPVARAYSVAFFATVCVSGLVTFTATGWSWGADKIIMYYGFLNPCIVFDHYPAKAVAMTGMCFFILIGILYSAMVFVSVYSRREFSATAWAGIVVWTVTLAHLAFVNVFVTNLYPLAEAATPRRLHGVHRMTNGTISLYEDPFEVVGVNGTMSRADISIVELHTAFYVVWLLGELWFLTYCAQMWKEVSQKLSCLSQLGHIGVAAVAFYGMAMHAAAMLVIILQNRPKVEWYFQEEMQSSVQWAIIWLDAKTGTSAWGWIPVMFYRWVFSTGSGVRVSMSLARRTGDDGGVLPEWWLGRALQTAAFVLGIGGAFVGTWEQDTTTVFRLASALRSKPFAYFGAPVLLAVFICFGLGLFLTCVQQRLMHRRLNWKLVVTAMSLFFALLGCMMVVLERERFTYMFFFGAVIGFTAWVLQLCAEKNLCGGLVYCASGGLLLALAIVTNFWLFYYLFLAWLCFYNPVVPDGRWVYITISEILEENEQYLPISVVSGGKELDGLVKPYLSSNEQFTRPPT